MFRVKALVDGKWCHGKWTDLTTARKAAALVRGAGLYAMLEEA